MVGKNMITQLTKLSITLLLVFSFASSAFAQAPPPGGVGEQKAPAIGGPRKQLATIIFAGIGGAILGLSTLSFYGRPQDELKNIAYGLAFGVIAGTAYVTYKAASNPQELYGTRPQGELELERMSAYNFAPMRAPMAFNYQFEF